MLPWGHGLVLQQRLRDTSETRPVFEHLTLGTIFGAVIFGSD